MRLDLVLEGQRAIPLHDLVERLRGPNQEVVPPSHHGRVEVDGEGPRSDVLLEERPRLRSLVEGNPCVQGLCKSSDLALCHRMFYPTVLPKDFENGSRASTFGAVSL